MAITGLVMVGFLLMHMYGNLKMFNGPEAFDGYAHWLKGDILYPIVPKGTFIWIFRAFMVLSIVVHIYCALTLWQRARVANPQTYEAKRQLAQTYSARTMRWGGIILAGFLVFHLLQFTVRSSLVAASPDATAYDMVIGEFRVWWLVAFYALWMVAVSMHVRHGFWSAFATLGANTSEKSQAVLNGCAWVVALLIYFGFMIMPLAVLTGVLN